MKEKRIVKKKSQEILLNKHGKKSKEKMKIMRERISTLKRCKKESYKERNNTLERRRVKEE